MSVRDRGVGLLGLQEMGLAGCRARRPDRVVSIRDRANCLTARSTQTPAMLNDIEQRVFELPVTGGVKNYLVCIAIVPFRIAAAPGQSQVSESGVISYRMMVGLVIFNHGQWQHVSLRLAVAVFDIDQAQV